MRAESIIAQVYQQKRELEEQNIKTTQVIMCFQYYKIIRAYHLLLGAIANTDVDYLGEDTIWGLEIMIDNQQKFILVR